jgi:Uma2 family endonuclease
VEIADTSLRYDIKTKMPLYAEHGVPEYWVIHAATLMTTVHRQPSGNVYAFVEEVSSDEQLVPALVPELAISLRALALDWTERWPAPGTTSACANNRLEAE